MLTIREAQLDILALGVRQQFVVALARHLAARFPHLDGPDWPDSVASIVDRAVQYGFRDRGHIAAWAELECEHGAGFEHRPEFESVHQVLALSVNPATKLYKIRRRISPPDNADEA